MVAKDCDISIQAEALVKEVGAWCEAIVSGGIVACKWVRLAVERYLRDVETGGERGLWLDAESALSVVQFFEFLRHYEGDFAGEPIRLELWEKFIVMNVYGFRRADGTRRFRTAYNELARKNGKSTFAAGLGLYGLVADGENAPQIYSGAVTKKQARDVLHRKAEKYVKHSPTLQRNLNVSKVEGTISWDLNDGTYQTLGKDSDTQEGFNPHLTILDELHAHKDRTVWDVIDSAVGARSQPLVFVITTAGFNQAGICYEQRDYACQVLEGGIEDDTFFGVIFTIDVGDDWRDEACWPKANPNLGISVRLDDMRRMATKAAKRPAELNNFLTKKLNVWTSQTVAWTNTAEWKESPPAVDETELIGKACFSGLDLSSNIDLTAVVHLFPWHDHQLVVLPRFWIPADNIRERSRSDRVLYEKWVDEGLVTATDGNVIDYESVIGQVKADGSQFDVEQIGFDRWGFEAIRQRLIGDEGGIPEEKMVAFGQGYASMSPAMKKLEELYMAHRLIGLNHPVLLWMAGNVQAKSDPAENIKPVKGDGKGHSTKRIDGIVALIMAIGLWSTVDMQPSVYETRGLRTV